jgi:hypothetical protein
MGLVHSALGRKRIDSIVRDLNVSARRLERNFLTHVGMSPSSFLGWFGSIGRYATFLPAEARLGRSSGWRTGTPIKRTLSRTFASLRA